MPIGVASVVQLADGVRVNKANGQSVTITSADIPASVASKPFSQIEAFVVSWFNQRGYSCACHLISLSPLKLTLVIGDLNVSPQLFFFPDASNPVVP